MPNPFRVHITPLPFRPFRPLFAIILLAACLAGCAQMETVPEEDISQESDAVQSAAETQPPPVTENTPPTDIASAVSTPEVASIPLTPKPAKATVGACYGNASANGKKRKKNAGRCEPQSLPFARCRSGIDTCKQGDTGPLTWFACEKKRGNTGNIPRKGSILILDANNRRKMFTGHVVYVEDVIPEGADTWKLILSHTNYDRQCSLDANVVGRYSKKTGRLDFLSGAWASWGKGLQVSGFILN